MTGMSRYYLSRAFVSVAFAGVFIAAGSPWWMAALAGVSTFTFFLWAPRSGRYVVHPKRGATALQRDERTQAITNRAARNAFVVIALTLAGLAVYFGYIAPGDVPAYALSLVLALGLLAYFATDLWLRRV